MTTEELITELTTEGLRLASDDEAGWTYAYIDEYQERVTVWVTEAN